MYYTPPYTNGSIEKVTVNLAVFDKTSVLQPGQSETVTLTFDKMVNLIAYSGFATVEVPSIKKIASLNSDGPAGVNYFVSGLFGMGYCGEILLAQIWNIDLPTRRATESARSLRNSA